MLASAVLALAVLAMPVSPDPPRADWMLEAHPAPTVFTAEPARGAYTLSNGIVSRTWVARRGFFTCTSLQHVRTGEEFLRAVRPEAEFVIDGRTVVVGGASGQPDGAYLDPAWLEGLGQEDGSFQFVGAEEGPVQTRFAWKPRAERRAERLGTEAPAGFQPRPWPPRGKRVSFDFKGQGPFGGLRATVAYELYDGLPVFCKQVVLHNGGSSPVRVDGFKAEILAAVEGESGVDSQDQWRLPNLTVTTDFTFAGMSIRPSNRAVRWVPDPTYTTQVNYELKTPCVMEAAAPVGPAITVGPGESFSTFRVFELAHDATDRERKGLQVRRMFRTLAPWCLENPIMLHLTSSDPTVVRGAIDQASECGFEMVVISFWSGLDMEDISTSNLEKWKSLADYAHSKGLELGGYSLLASRSVGPETDVVDPKTGKPGGAVFGSSPCLGSAWGVAYFEKLRTFIESTGFDLLEHDGSYPGDVCASTSHPGHRGLEDSQWTQFAAVTDFYHWCRERGVFLNVPDNYFLQGSNKTGMGYRESNWSLPRSQQHVHARQNLYDGTWEKTPSMGWMMVPLVEYQGGGPAATIEPLSEHLSDYEMHLANNFGFGAQACYRGPRLYDSSEVKAAVRKWVDWFKAHREVLEGDVVHLRRANGRTWDAVLHVNPFGQEKAMLVVWNPSDREARESLDVPLHDAGLSKSCRIAGAEGKASRLALDGRETAVIRVRVPARGMTWLVFS